MPLSLDQAVRGERPPQMTKTAWQRMHDRSRELMVEALRFTVDRHNLSREQERQHE